MILMKEIIDKLLKKKTFMQTDQQNIRYVSVGQSLRVQNVITLCFWQQS